MAIATYLNTQDFEEEIGKTDLVLIPFGAVEVYGPHLPMGADGIATQALCERIAAEEPAIIAPLLGVGCSQRLNLERFKGTISIRPETLIGYARDVVESYIGWGARRFMFVNGHRGNSGYLSDLGFELEETYDVRVAQIDWWQFIPSLTKDLEESDVVPHGHAAEFSTSVMLALVPEHVKMERATRDLPSSTHPFPDIIHSDSYRLRPASGLVGDASFGNAEKGEETIRRATQRVLEYIRSDYFKLR